jgi:hypothetical protein
MTREIPWDASDEIIASMQRHGLKLVEAQAILDPRSRYIGQDGVETWDTKAFPPRTRFVFALAAWPARQTIVEVDIAHLETPRVEFFDGLFSKIDASLRA